MQKSSRRVTRVRREVNRAVLLRALRMIKDDLVREPALMRIDKGLGRTAKGFQQMLEPLNIGW